jgi:DNA polymerase
MPAAKRARPGAEPFVPDTTNLETLRTASYGCQGCELYADASQTVFGEGGIKAALMLVGEQPGDREDAEGRPFVGPAGKLLDRALAEAGIESRTVFRTNAVKHFRFKQRGKRRIHDKPDVGNIVACRPWLIAELTAVRPTGVVVLGATAVRSVLGPGAKLMHIRGTRLPWPADQFESLGDAPPAWVLATIHPSAVLRSKDRTALYGGLVADLRAAARELS